MIIIIIAMMDLFLSKSPLDTETGAAASPLPGRQQAQDYRASIALSRSQRPSARFLAPPNTQQKSKYGFAMSLWGQRRFIFFSDR